MDFFDLLSMIGGLALFLYGMNLLGDGRLGQGILFRRFGKAAVFCNGYEIFQLVEVHSITCSGINGTNFIIRDSP